MARKRKPNEMLSSVVNESVPDSAFDLLMENEAFVLPDNMGVILMLDVDDPSFGGLSKKQTKQEDKGAIIKQLEGDGIASLVTADMLAENVLGIIPTPRTLDNMSDFTILTEAEYLWGVVQLDEDGSLVAFPVQDATFAEAVRISDGETSLQQVMPKTWKWALDGDDAQIEEESEAFEASEDSTRFDNADDDLDTGDIEKISVDDTDEDDFGGADTFASDEYGDPFSAEDADDYGDDDMHTGSIGAVEAIASGEIPIASSPEYSEPDWGNSEPDWGEVDESSGSDIDDNSVDVVEDEDDEEETYEEDDSYERYVADNADREVSVDEVRNSIVRRFAPEDLDLTIDMALFDETFNYPSPRLDYTPIGSDWLDSQVGLMVEQANAELANQHWSNLSSLREQYVTMVSRFGEDVAKRMSITKPGSRFADMMLAAKEDYEKSRQRSDEITASERNAIIERFNKEADTVAEAAAASARSRYEAQNRPHRERLLSEVSTRVNTQIEERYVANKSQVLELRASEAENWFDLGVTRVMETLSKQSEKNRDIEADLMDEWNENINKFMDENRKEDIARAQAQRDRESRENQVEQVRAQAAAELASVKSAMVEKVSALEAELVRVRDRALTDQRARDDQWTAQLTAANLKVEQSTALAEQMQKNLSSVRDTISSQFEAQVSELRREKERLEDRMQADAKSASRTRNIIIGVTVIVAILAILVGIIGGFVIGAGYNSSAGSSASSGIDIVTGLDSTLFT